MRELQRVDGAEEDGDGPSVTLVGGGRPSQCNTHPQREQERARQRRAMYETTVAVDTRRPPPTIRNRQTTTFVRYSLLTIPSDVAFVVGGSPMTKIDGMYNYPAV